ncbi:MAG TPA: hypothetical protein PLV52_02110 [Candidatus Omnitrophota bacterium]|nr:hypothetical protein [Candidatus Omnitrophota bacterium]
MRKVYLVETAEHARDLAVRERGLDDIFIALSPFAMHELDVRGISYSIPEDFYPPAELWNLNSETDGLLSELCRRLDRFACARSDSLKKRGIDLYTNYGYPLNVIFSGIATRIFQLQAIFKAMSPCEAICFRSAVYPFHWRGIGFDNRELLYSRILKSSGWKGLVDSITFKETVVKGPSKNKAIVFSVNSIKDLLKKRFPLLRDIKKSGAMTAFTNLVFKDSMVFLTLGAEYEWSECESYFNQKGARMRSLGVRHYEEGSPVPSEDVEIEIKEELGKLMTFRGIDISAIVLPRLLFIHEVGSIRCIKAHDHAERSILRSHPSALLCSVLPMAEWRSAAAVFNREKIPVFFKSHGATGIFDIVKSVLDNELRYADYFLANGVGVEAFYKQVVNSYTRTDIRVISTGSPKLAKLMSEKRPVDTRLAKWIADQKVLNRKIGIYVTGNYFRNLSHIIFDPPYSDILIFKTQTAVVDFFKARSDVSLIWKLHPAPANDRPPIIGKVAANIYKIHDEVQFADLLDLPDFIIIDVPGTACLQAMTRRLPIFGVTRHGKYLPNAGELLKRRVVCRDQPADLLKEVERFIEDGAYDADLDDKSFFEEFGTGSGIDPVQATAEAVLEVARKNPR